MANLEEVFKKAGVPSYTFVEPKEYTKIIVALRTPGRALIIEGPSGIGKTSCVKKAIDELHPDKNYKFLSARKPKDVLEIKKIPISNDPGIYVIDDFHRLPSSTKKSVTDFIKLLADDENENIKIVLIGINRAGQSLIDYASDLLHRAESVKFGRSSIEKIDELIKLGEAALNCTIGVAGDIAAEAEGSFAMAQVLCHEACIQSKLISSHPGEDVFTVDSSLHLIRESVLEELSSRFFDPARDFCTGNKLRKEGRAPYLHLLQWLSESTDGALDTKEAIATHPLLKGSISQVIEKSHLLTLIESKETIAQLIYFDADSGILTTEDPKFHYYIRHLIWSKFSRQVGFNIIEFKSKFDFALSFAGADRYVAEKFHTKLTERGFSVFYDVNEQHRILSNDVEEYLAPIYRADARYVVSLISNSYPKRIWTKFESSQFKHRFGEGSVIPIVFSECSVGLFDEVSTRGYLSINPENEIDAQIDELVCIMIRKLETDIIESEEVAA